MNLNFIDYSISNFEVSYLGFTFKWPLVYSSLSNSNFLIWDWCISQLALIGCPYNFPMSMCSLIFIHKLDVSFTLKTFTVWDSKSIVWFSDSFACEIPNQIHQLILLILQLSPNLWSVQFIFWPMTVPHLFSLDYDRIWLKVQVYLLLGFQSCMRHFAHHSDKIASISALVRWFTYRIPKTWDDFSWISLRLIHNQ